MRLSLCLLTLLLRIQSHVRTSTAQKLGDIEPLYIFTPRPAPGNCDRHRALLQTTYSEAIDMVNRSINVIDSLEVPLSQLETSDERANWKAWAQLLKAVFNISVDITRGLDLNNANVTLIKGYFEAMLKYQNYEPPLQAPGRYWLFCDDSYYRWISPPAKAVLDRWRWRNDGGKGRLRIEKYGYWNGTGGTTVYPFYDIYPGFEGQNKKSFKCYKKTLAFSRPALALTFCSKTFQKFPYSAAQLQAAKKVRYSAQLSTLQTLGTVMIHEWGHLINKLDDQFAVNEDGIPLYYKVGPNPPRAVPTTSAVPDTTPSERDRAVVYGWDLVIWLARYEPDKARRTPEAYMFFAMAVYYTQTNNLGLQYSYGYGLLYGQEGFQP